LFFATSSIAPVLHRCVAHFIASNIIKQYTNKKNAVPPREKTIQKEKTNLQIDCTHRLFLYIMKTEQ